MSGGAFNYSQHYINDIIEALEENKQKIDNEEEEYYQYEDKDRIIDNINWALYYLDRAYIYTQRLDYLLSGDDSESTFYKRLSEDWNKLKDRIEEDRFTLQVNSFK